MKHALTGQGGKGSAPRATDKAKFDKGYDRIFNKVKCPECGSTDIELEWQETNGQEWEQGVCSACEHEWNECGR